MSFVRSVFRRLFRWYRVPATGLCFLVFGLGAMIFSLLLLITPKGKSREARDASRRNMQEFTSLAFRAFLTFMWGVGILGRLEYRGLDNLPENEPCVIVANHPTLIDPVMLIGAIGKVDCIMKDKHMKIFGVIARHLGYIQDTDSIGLFDECEKRIRDGHRLLLFPERTRSPAYGLRDFSRVPAQVTIGAGCKLVPVLIDYNYQTLRRDQSWYDVPPEPMELTVTFFEPFKPELDGSFSEQSRKLTNRLKAFYREQLDPGD